jgi:hypothetical protein
LTAAAPKALRCDGNTAIVLADGSVVVVVGETSHSVPYLRVRWHRYATNPVSTMVASAELTR